MIIKIIFIILIASNVMLTACSIGGGRMHVSHNNEIADERLEQILSVIKDEDKEAMKGLFSKQALKETNDIDLEIN